MRPPHVLSAAGCAIACALLAGVLSGCGTTKIAEADLRNALNRAIEAERELEALCSVIAALREEGLVPMDRARRAGAQPAVPIHGKVLAVRAEVNLVTLSAGSLDGVKKGYRFTIFRGEDGREHYVGKVEVEKVFEDKSSARILVDWTREPIKEGDAASTRVY